MSRTARLARTAHDLSHVNHLRAPVFGVTKLCLQAGKIASRSYLPDGAPAQKQAKGATDDFCFAPIKEKIKILYTIDDAAGCITKAKLELFRRGVAAAILSVDLTKDEEISDGDHEREWDGKIPKDAKEFPEECVTVQHSPYKLKITVSADDGYGFPKMAWTYFHILVHEIELELGPKKVLPVGVAGAKSQRDLDLYDTLGGVLPAPDAKAPAKLQLVSNLFSHGPGDDRDQTWFGAYQTAWGEGPDIPIFAKPFVRNSSGKKEDVPEALGRVRFLWDWKDEKEDLSIHFKEAKEFLKDTLDFDQKTSKPPGDNCFGSTTTADDRGGKRGITTAGRIVYPAKAGETPVAALAANKFPFEVQQCTTRKWSSYSFTWPTGEYKGKTGVIFEPSRMAGDDYRVLVYCAHNRKPDETDNLDTEDNDFLKQAVKKSTGIFQIWREVHIVGYKQKAAGMTAIDLAKVASFYSKAYLTMVDKTGGVKGAFTTYDADLRARAGGRADHVRAAIEVGDQGTITRAGIIFRAHAAFVTQLETIRGAAVGGLAGWLIANGLDTPAGYQGQLEGFADQIVPQSLNSAMAASAGINICQFNKYWEATGGGSSTTSGFASTDVPGTSLTKRAYLQTFGPPEYAATYPPPRINNMQLTTTHEIGHCCFLTHADGAPGDVPALHDSSAHWNNCIMSYNYDKERKFCGLCLLRLRGWKAETVPPAASDPTNMTSTSASNKR
jgi:hypothetical protein